MMTDKELTDWCILEYARAESLSKEEADFVKRRAKRAFDIRFPNPDYCHVCGHRLE